MPSIRLNKVARDLQVGVKSIVDYLSEKDSTKEYNVNSKISLEEFKSVVDVFGKDLSPEERKALIEANAAPAKAEPKSEPEAKVEAPKKEEPKKEEPKKPTVAGPVIKGKVELDSKGNVVVPKKEPETAPKKASAGEAEQVAKKQEAPQKPEPKKPAPKKVEKPEKSETSDKSEEPKKVEQPAKPEQPKQPVTPPVAKPEPKMPEKVEEEDDTDTKEKNVFRLGRTEGMGVTLVGKVDLSKIQPETGKTSGSKTSSSKSQRNKRRERERIRGNKVDVDQVQKQGTKKEGEGKKHGAKQSATPKRSEQGERNDRAAAQQKQGRKARRKQKVEQKPEVSQEDIHKQIRETMAAIQGGRRKASSQAAKYRRDKREAHRKEMELEEQEQLMDKTLQLTEYVTANDLAQMIDVPVNDIIMICFNLGMMVSINQRLEKDTIDLILGEYGFTAEYVEAQMLDMIEKEEDTEEDLKPRAPIVTVMGHVDHGKTSLLDAIRNADVIDTEAGGITQHIGAYSVTLEEGKKITFLDTPGHEAFTAMRARGAKVTDIVIIVVAADDGVMPQTKEALSHASLADVPIIFAINKIDKPQANPDRIKEELANLNYLVEDWGGKYQSQEISAKKGTGIHELLEKVLLEAEIMELKANPDKKAVGSVLESTMERGLGYTTKVLIQEGTLRMGDFILAGENYGRVKALFNERGKNVESVGPAEPVKVLGLNGATQAGEVFNVLDTEAEVRDIANRRSQLKREQRERTQRLPSLQDLSRRIAEGNMQELNIIVKGDMDGSVEALSDSIVKLSTDEIRVNVIHKAVGQITESDVILASASDAIVIGFQVRPAQGARRMAEEEGVEIRLYSIIYDALDDIKTAMEGMLSPEIKEKVTANLEVRETFKVPRAGTIAGCYVRDGKVSRSDKVRVIRDGIVIHTGALGSLKRFKDDVREVTAGYECGLNIENYNDVLVGDLIEAFEEIQVKREL